MRRVRRDAGARPAARRRALAEGEAVGRAADRGRAAAAVRGVRPPRPVTSTCTGGPDRRGGGRRRRGALRRGARRVRAAGGRPPRGRAAVGAAAAATATTSERLHAGWTDEGERHGDAARARKLADRIQRDRRRDARAAGQGPAARLRHDHRHAGDRRPARGDGLLHGVRPDDERAGHRRGAGERQGRAALRGRPADRRPAHADPGVHADACRRTPGTSTTCSTRPGRADAEVARQRRAPPPTPARPTRTARPTRATTRGRRSAAEDRA